MKERKMSAEVQTWHFGLVARHWAENNTTGPEIAYYQRLIEHDMGSVHCNLQGNSPAPSLA
jgi:hypothetical protein